MRRPGWRWLRRRPMATAGLAVVALLVLVALLADLLASDLPIVLRRQGQTFILPAITRPAQLVAFDNQLLRREMSEDDWAWMPLIEFGPEQQPAVLRPPPASPDRTHWLGTDDRGRDVLARLIHGTRVALLVGLGAVAIYVVVGLVLGLLAGYYRGRVDWVIGRLVELGLTFPTFFLVLTIMALLDRQSLWTLVVVIGATGWTGVARLVRAEVLRLREMDFVAAARALGASDLRIITRHLLPNALGPVLVNAAFGVAGAILAEAALTFLGFGTPPPVASWGEVLSQAYEYQDRWWLVICPGLAIFVTVLALNALGEALREALDPRLRQTGW